MYDHVFDSGDREERSRCLVCACMRTGLGGVHSADVSGVLVHVVIVLFLRYECLVVVPG